MLNKKYFVDTSNTNSNPQNIEFQMQQDTVAQAIVDMANELNFKNKLKVIELKLKLLKTDLGDSFKNEELKKLAVELHDISDG